MIAAPPSAPAKSAHFCAPYSGNVDEWTARDWADELDQFDALMFSGHALPFGPDELVGTRTPCLEGRLQLLYPVLARRGFRYDASQYDSPRVPRRITPVPDHPYRLRLASGQLVGQMGADAL